MKEDSILHVIPKGKGKHSRSETMKRVQISFLIVVFISSLNTEPTIPENITYARIHGGFIPKKRIFAEHMVSLRYGSDDRAPGSNHFCGGSIISKKAVLTALHCVKNPDTGEMMKMKNIRVVVGSTDLFKWSGAEEILDVRKIIQYPKKTKVMGTDDLAILHLKKDISEDGSHIQRVPLANRAPKTGDQCIFLGFGKLYPDGPLPDQLLYMNVTLQPDSYCDTPEELICIGDVNTFPMLGEKGDSGGPLICNGRLVGVCSFAMDVRSYFVSVYQYLAWIKANSDASKNLLCLGSIVASLTCFLINY